MRPLILVCERKKILEIYFFFFMGVFFDINLINDLSSRTQGCILYSPPPFFQLDFLPKAKRQRLQGWLLPLHRFFSNSKQNWYIFRAFFLNLINDYIENISNLYFYKSSIEKACFKLVGKKIKSSPYSSPFPSHSLFTLPFSLSLPHLHPHHHPRT